MRLRALGLRQTDLAEKLGSHKQTINNVINGKIRNYARLPEIAAILGVTSEWLVNGDPPPDAGCVTQEVYDEALAAVDRMAAEISALRDLMTGKRKPAVSEASAAEIRTRKAQERFRFSKGKVLA